MSEHQAASGLGWPETTGEQSTAQAEPKTVSSEHGLGWPQTQTHQHLGHQDGKA